MQIYTSTMDDTHYERKMQAIQACADSMMDHVKDLNNEAAKRVRVEIYATEVGQMSKADVVLALNGCRPDAMDPEVAGDKRKQVAQLWFDEAGGGKLQVVARYRDKRGGMTVMNV